MGVVPREEGAGHRDTPTSEETGKGETRESWDKWGNGDQCCARLHGEVFSVHPGAERLYAKSLQGRALGISLRGKDLEDSTTPLFFIL